MKNEQDNASVMMAKSVIFSADISNEEAQWLQKLKEEKKIRLICPEAKAYQEFMRVYNGGIKNDLHRDNLEALNESRLVMALGVWFEDARADALAMIETILKQNEPTFIFMHPIEDRTLLLKDSHFIKYEAGSEEGVAALMTQALLQQEVLPQEVRSALDDLDIGYLSAESNVGEEEFEWIEEFQHDKNKITLLVGSDLYTHPKAKQIATLLALLERYAHINVLCIPPAPNALGVGLICELDSVIQEPAVLFKSEYKENKGFVLFDDSAIMNRFTNHLSGQTKDDKFILEEIDDLPVFNGAVIYTYGARKNDEQNADTLEVLSGSKQFAVAAKLQDGEVILFEVEGVKMKRVFRIDTHMKGVIALNPTLDIKLSASLLSSYRFSRLAFEKINNQIGNNYE